jgi:hypothetical protein
LGIKVENQHRKISGYRELNQDEIDLMNRIKSFGPELEKLITDMKEKGADGRWVSIGQTHLQQGLMGLTRSVAKPEFF